MESLKGFFKVILIVHVKLNLVPKNCSCLSQNKLSYSLDHLKVIIQRRIMVLYKIRFIQIYDYGNYAA